MPVRRTTVVSAVAFGAAAQLLFYGQVPGISAPIAVALFLALAWRARSRAIALRDAWLPAFAMVLAGFLAIRTEAPLVAFDLTAAVALSVASAAALGSSVTDLPLTALVRRAMVAGLAPLLRAWRPISREWRVLLPLRPLHRAAPAAAGVAIALPILGVFTLLFASADAVFARALRDALGRLPDRLGETPGRVALGALAAWGAAGTLTLAHDRERPASMDLPRPLHRESAATLLIAVDVLFALFVAVQLAYLFGGRDTLDAAGIGYSAYARRGFFELVAAAILVAGLLFAVELFADRRTRAYLAAALGLVGLTGVVLASAAYRLDLYQVAYGWSELRFYALAATAFLGLALLILAWALAARRMAHVVQPAVLAGLVLAVTVNAAGPTAFIARANIARAAEADAPAQDARQSFDAGYLFTLGDAAVPALVEALPALSGRDRECVDALLRWNVARRDLYGPTGWQAFNVDRARAVEALRAYASRIPSAGRDDHAGDARLQRQIALAQRTCGDP